MDYDLLDLVMLYAIETNNWRLLNAILDMLMGVPEAPQAQAQAQAQQPPPGGEPDWLLMEWGGPYPEDDDVLMTQ